MFFLIGALAGLTNGLFGAGGGILLVPMYLKYSDMKPKETFATSISVIFVLSLVTIQTYIANQTFSLENGYIFIIGGFLGGILAIFAFKKVEATILKRILGLIIIYGGVRFLFL